MTDSSSDISVLFEALRAEYAAKLPGKIAAIEQAWQAAQQDPWDPQVNDRLYRSLHTLAGSSGTYGFRSLSERARTAEVYVGSILSSALPPSSNQCERISALLGALRAALED